MLCCATGNSSVEMTPGAEDEYDDDDDDDDDHDDDDNEDAAHDDVDATPGPY